MYCLQNICRLHLTKKQKDKMVEHMGNNAELGFFGYSNSQDEFHAWDLAATHMNKGLAQDKRRDPKKWKDVSKIILKNLFLTRVVI